MVDIIDSVIDEIVDSVVSEYKHCSTCGITKMKSEFHEDKAKKDGYKGKCKGCIAKYRQDNKETLAKKKAIYIQDNKEVIAKRNAIWRQNNKEAIAKQRASYYQDNKEAIAKKNSIYRQENKEGISKRRSIKYQKETQVTRKKRNKHHASYKRKRRQTDEGYRIEHNLRSRMRNALKGTRKSASTMKLTGLDSGTQMKEYLELVNPELKDVKCDIDHRLPCSMYDLTLPEHQNACFHYTNLQWLIPEVNQFKKGAKYPPDLKSELDDRNKFKDEAPTVQKQLALISHIESQNLSFKQVVELQRAGELYEVVGW